MPQKTGSDNAFLTDDVIMKEAMRILKNECVATRLVHRDTEKRMGMKIGGKISMRKPQRFKSTSGRTIGIQPMIDQNISLSIDRQENVGLTFNAIDRTLAIQDFSSRYLKPAVIQLAHKLDLSILKKAKNRFFFSSGTPGTAPNQNEFIDASAYMSMIGHPDDGMTSNVLNPLAAANFRKSITTLANEEYVKTAIERSMLPAMGGNKSFETAQMVTHTVGALGGSPLINGASQTGFGNTQTLNIDGAALSVTGWALEGDTFTIPGVFEINPQTYDTTGRLQRFVVTADADSDGAGNVALSISPPINDGTVTTTDGDGAVVSAAAYQNVTAAPADNAALTFIGTANITYRQNMILHRDAIGLCVVDIEAPSSAVTAERVRDEKTGLSILMTAAYNVNDMTEICRLDILWGVECVYPQLGHRVWGG